MAHRVSHRLPALPCGGAHLLLFRCPDLRVRLSADPTPKAAAKARNRTSGLQPLPTSDAVRRVWGGVRECVEGRRGRRSGACKGAFSKPVLPPQILNCPSCMTTLCLDCQRHERHLNQFRAMFVMNMYVNHDEVLEFKEPAKKEPKWKQAKRGKQAAGEEGEAAADGAVPSAASEATRPEDQFNPAHCAECSTLVRRRGRGEGCI